MGCGIGWEGRRRMDQGVERGCDGKTSLFEILSQN